MAANLMKPFNLIAMIIMCNTPIVVFGEVLSDPTRPPSNIDGSASVSGLAAHPKVRGLQSVIISPKYCAAIIDGKTVVLGAQHGEEKLVEISGRGIVLESKHGRRALMLFPTVGMKLTETVPKDKQQIKCQVKQNIKALSPPEQVEQEDEK